MNLIELPDGCETGRPSVYGSRQPSKHLGRRIRRGSCVYERSVRRDLILKVLLIEARSRRPVGFGDRQEGCWIRDNEQSKPGSLARLDQRLRRFGVAGPEADAKRGDPDGLEPRNVSLPPDPAGRKD